MGQITRANNKNKLEEGSCHSANALFVKDSQTQPSANCCIAKIKGIPANGICVCLVVLRTEAIPITASIAAEPKLAVAEKHMSLQLVYANVL